MSTRRPDPPRHEVGGLFGEAISLKPGFSFEPVGVSVGAQGYFIVEVRYGDIQPDPDQEFLIREGVPEGRSLKVAVTNIENTDDRKNVAEKLIQNIFAVVERRNMGQFGREMHPHQVTVCRNSFRTKYVVAILEQVGGEDFGEDYLVDTLIPAAMDAAAGTQFTIPGDSDSTKAYTWKLFARSVGSATIHVTPT